MHQNIEKKLSLKSSLNNSNFIPVAKIVGFHGLKGWLKLDLYTDFLDRLGPGEVVLLDEQQAKISGITHHKNRPLILIEGTNSRTDAEALRGRMIFAENKPIPLEQNEFRIGDLIGIDVETVDGKKLGKITNIIQGSVQDLLVVDELMIPMVHEFVKDIDTYKRKIIVKLIPGMEPNQ